MKLYVLLLISILTSFSLYSQEEKMEIDGAIQIGDSQDPSPDNGTIRYNGLTKDFEGWTGERWESLTDDGRIEDVDGNIYNTVAIGKQIWMSESLRTTMFRDSTMIPEVSDSTEWIVQTEPALAWLHNDKSNNQFPYGAYYNWFAIQGEICPEGWRVPSKADYNQLLNFIGNNNQSAYVLMTTDTSFWNNYTELANNLTGFNAIEGGYRSVGSGTFGQVLSEYWTTSSPYQAVFIRRWDGFVGFINAGGSTAGLPVRCLKE